MASLSCNVNDPITYAFIFLSDAYLIPSIVLLDAGLNKRRE
uniref:Uncharacterized protein n=1 Tax=Rhizophora mucronata TaxID=61149 RepID=A0A2P2PT12_RHIMU